MEKVRNIGLEEGRGLEEVPAVLGFLDFKLVAHRLACQFEAEGTVAGVGDDKS